MTDSSRSIEVEPILLKDLAEALPQTRIFAATPFAAIAGVERVERVTVKAGATLVEAGQPWLFYWLVLEGEIRAERPEPDGTLTLVGIVHAGEGFGEVPLLIGRATVDVPRHRGAGFGARPLQRAGFLVVAGLLPLRAQNRPGR